MCTHVRTGVRLATRLKGLSLKLQKRDADVVAAYSLIDNALCVKSVRREPTLIISGRSGMGMQSPSPVTSAQKSTYRGGQSIRMFSNILLSHLIRLL